MAKTGFWLQGAKGKFAGAALQKTAYGSTMMREIVKPKNPQTQRQMYQRAILATVIRMYAAGNAIFDHSFEGVQAGAKSQSKFVSLNTKQLRSNIIEGDKSTNVCAPGIMAAVPNDYQISAGSYAQTFLNHMRINYDEEETYTVKELCALNGLVEDDLYTICGLRVSDITLFELPDHTDWEAKVCQSEFFWIRLRVKNTDSIEQAAKLNQFLEVDAYSVPFGSIKSLDQAISNHLSISNFINSRNFQGQFGVIRSREDSGLRSTSSMEHIEDYDGGLAAKYLLEAWMPSTGGGLGNPSKILNGADSTPIDAYDISQVYAMIDGDERIIDLSQPETLVAMRPRSVVVRGSKLNLANLSLVIDTAGTVLPTFEFNNTIAHFSTTDNTATKWELKTNGNPWITLALDDSE